MDIIDDVQEERQVVIILTGNIGTGKTTRTEFLCENYIGSKIVVISNDGITMMTSNGAYQRYNPELHDMYKDMFIKCLCVAIDAGASVVCDNAHMTKASRKGIIKIAKDAGIPVTGIDLGPGSPESLLRRQTAVDKRNTPNSTWCMVHQRFAKQYEPLDISEGFDCIVNESEMRAITDEY